MGATVKSGLTPTMAIFFTYSDILFDFKVVIQFDHGKVCLKETKLG
jgi:hypothetical protein